MMRLPNFLSKKRQPSRHPWQWPLCKHTKTLSFRAAGPSDDMFKTLNSVFFDLSDAVETKPETRFAKVSEPPRCSTQSEEPRGESLEMIIRGAQSARERLFFEPDDTRSIVKVTETKASRFLLEESVMLAMESADPYEDFKRSMVEMVEIHGLKDWECLEEMLGWYLRVNAKMNHGFIVGAFIDLLVAMASPSSTDSTSYSSAASSFISCPSSPLSPLMGHQEIDQEDSMV
ncbi:hypothetical protein NMG60_11022118 [Bertholletia excelsa]